MEMKILAQRLGINHQMANRYKRRGMPCESLETAQAWFKATINPFRSKVGRIGGNSGVQYQSRQSKSDNLNIETTNQPNSEAVRRILTRIVPDLWFSQVNRLNTALQEHEIHLPAESLLEIQSLLFLLYQIEADRYLETESAYSIPPILMIKPGNKNYPSMIASLEQALKTGN